MTLAMADTTGSMPASVGTVLIVDDHSLITQGLSLALRAEGLDVHVVMEPDRELVLALVRVHHPTLVLLDLQFGGTAHEGLELIEAVAERATVLMLTGVSDQAVLGSCLERGAIGVASKGEAFDRLLERIQLALRGESVMSLREREDLLAASRERRDHEAKRFAAFSALSQREREVLHQLASGFAADAIAERSFVSVATVRTHIQAILRKLDVNTQLAAVARAHEAGWTLNASL